MRPHVGHVRVLQCREADCGAHVLGEDEERTAIGESVPVQRDAVEHRSHRMFADTEVEVTAVRVRGERRRRDRLGAEGRCVLDQRVVRAGEIGGTAPQLRERGGERLDRRLGGLAGRDALGIGLPGRQLSIPARRQVAAAETVVQVLPLRIGVGPLCEELVPLRVNPGAALEGLPGVLDDVLGDLERCGSLQAHRLAHGLDLVGSERGAVRRAGVHLLRRREADHRTQDDERRLVGDLSRGLQRFFDRLEVVRAIDVQDVPAVGLVACRDILGEGDVRVVLDGDVVRVVHHDEVAELLRTRKGGRLGGDALLHVTVGGDDIDEMVEGALALGSLRVEQPALETSRHGHADCGGQSLSERTRGRFHTLCVVNLRVPRGEGAPFTKLLEVLDLEPIAGQVELNVLQKARVACGEHETIASGPVGVRRIDPHDALVQGVGERRETHRGAGVAATAVLDRIRSEHPRRRHGLGIQFGPVGRIAVFGEFGNFRRTEHCRGTPILSINCKVNGSLCPKGNRLRARITDTRTPPA